MNHLQALQQAFGPSEGRALYRWVMEECFGLTLAQILMGKDTDLSEDEQQRLKNIVARLLTGEPVQYVVGHTTFCEHTFHVAPGVLIPRPETEQLVRLILQRHSAPLRLLDIGTGSGCIAISLALAGHHVSAFDVSPEALAVARKNAETLGAKINFQLVDILHPTVHWKGNIIVSNPPYICHREASEMEAHVLNHEPHLALFVPDDDPLLFYRAITLYALQALTPGGMLYFECNRAYVDDVCHLMHSHGFQQVESIVDDFGNLRFAIGSLP